jgi:hypothetical protein
MRGTIPPLPNTPSWRGVQLKKKSTGTTLPFIETNPKGNDHFKIDKEVYLKLKWQHSCKMTHVVYVGGREM